MSRIDRDRLNAFLLLRQHLADVARHDDVVQIVRDIGGLHATNAATPYLSLFARQPTAPMAAIGGSFAEWASLERQRLDAELYERRTLGRIRCMRKTVYILPRESLAMAWRATCSMSLDTSRRYLAFRGIATEQYEMLSRAIIELLRGRTMTVAEMRKALGTTADLSAVVNLMCDDCLLIRDQPAGGWRASNHRYALFEECFPHPGTSDDEIPTATTDLVRHYLAAFAPATLNDAAWWTGLGKAAVREALKRLGGEVAPLSIDGVEGEFLLLRSDLELLEAVSAMGHPTVNLLPTLDPYLMAYKDRTRYLEARYYHCVYDRAGNATHTVLVDGRVAGIWDVQQDRPPLVKLYFFEDVDGATLSAVREEARRVGAFVTGREVEVRACDAMVPLTERTAGSVYSPLKAS